MIKINIKSTVAAFTLATLTGLGNVSSAGVFDQLVSAANGALPSYGREHSVGYRPDLENEQIAAAIREALSVSSDRVAKNVLSDAAYQDGAIRLSRDLRKVQKLAVKRGHGEIFDQLQQQLNEAVLAAAPETRDLLKSALGDIEIVEPRVLLIAHDTAATDYLRLRLAEKLQRQLYPVVAKLLAQTGATATANVIASEIKFGNLLATIMSNHVVDYSIDSFFLNLEQQERAIRLNPRYRTTEQLRNVFGLVGDDSVAAVSRSEKQ